MRRIRFTYILLGFAVGALALIPGSALIGYERALMAFGALGVLAIILVVAQQAMRLNDQFQVQKDGEHGIRGIHGVSPFSKAGGKIREALEDRMVNIPKGSNPRACSCVRELEEGGFAGIVRMGVTGHNVSYSLTGRTKPEVVDQLVDVIRKGDSQWITRGEAAIAETHFCHSKICPLAGPGVAMAEGPSA